MAENELRVSQLNRISGNREFNEIVVSSKTTENDPGITKKIRMDDLLYESIVKRINIEPKIISTDKIDDLAVTREQIANKTITENEILNNSIKNELIDSEAITSRNLKVQDNYTADQFTAISNLNSNGGLKSNTLEVESANVKINDINYNFPNQQFPQFFLKTDGAGNLSWAEAVPGSGTSLTFSEILPVGTIVPWSSNTLPGDGKWLLCNGNTFIGNDYPDLKQFLIDNNQPFGTSTDGINYFLPDLRARTIVGVGTSTDGDGNSDTFNLASSRGVFKHALAASEMQHRHVTGSFVAEDNDDWRPFIATNSGVLYSSFTFNSRWIAGESNNTNYADTNPNTSARQTQTSDLYDTNMVTAVGHNNIQPSLGLNYIIKAKKDDIVHYNPTLGPGLSALDGDGLQSTTLTLSSIEVGIKPNFEDFTFDGSNQLSLNENISLSAINFTSDGSTLSSANIGWNFAGDSSNNLPLVYEDKPPALDTAGLPFDEIDLAPYMRGEARRALVRILAVSSVGSGTSVYFRPKGSYGNIPELNMRSQAGTTGAGTVGATVGVDFVKGGINGQRGSMAEVMTDAQGKIEIQSTNNKQLKIYLESYQFFTS